MQLFFWCTSTLHRNSPKNVVSASNLKRVQYDEFAVLEYLLEMYILLLVTSLARNIGDIHCISYTAHKLSSNTPPCSTVTFVFRVHNEFARYLLRNCFASNECVALFMDLVLKRRQKCIYATLCSSMWALKNNNSCSPDIVWPSLSTAWIMRWCYFNKVSPSLPPTSGRSAKATSGPAEVHTLWWLCLIHLVVWIVLYLKSLKYEFCP